MKTSHAKTFFKWGCALILGETDKSCENFKSYTPLDSLINDFLESKDQKLYISPLLSILIQVKKCVTVKLNKLILKQEVKAKDIPAVNFQSSISVWPLGLWFLSKTVAGESSQ